jgi:hypothetical protein
VEKSRHLTLERWPVRARVTAAARQGRKGGGWVVAMCKGQRHRQWNHTFPSLLQVKELYAATGRPSSDDLLIDIKGDTLHWRLVACQALHAWCTTSVGSLLTTCLHLHPHWHIWLSGCWMYRQC